MGLAGPRKRVKLSHDPNNTRWTHDTGGFGHRIMTAQGWQPGDILGVKNASHAEFHTAASASHIRVIMKDDNLGLGAKRGSDLTEDGFTGLDAFQSLLGRLNGKEEDELMKEQKAREDLRRAIYTDRRWGLIRFVKGGFLIGDKIQELVSKEKDQMRQTTQESVSAVPEVVESKCSSPQISDIQVAKNKTKKKRRKVEREQGDSTEIVVSKGKSGQTSKATQNDPQDTRSLKPKRSKKKRRQSDGTEEPLSSILDEQDVSRGSRKEKKKHKATTEPKKPVGGGATTDHSSTSHSSPVTPAAPEKQPSSSQSLFGGRHMVRSRNIAQKRLAVLDTASLNQIFMIKK